MISIEAVQGGAIPPVTERISELRVIARLRNGKTELKSRYHTSPLKIAKTFTLSNSEGSPQLAVVQMDGSPGLLEGDSYLFDWHLEENSRLYVTNQAYTRVHPCEGGSSKLVQRLSLESGAVLEWIPEPIMLFRNARFKSETSIDLAERSVCVLSDIFCPGRLSRGEAFHFQSYDSKLSVSYKGELIHYQRQKWEPAILPIESTGCFGGFTHLGALSVFSDLITPDVVIKVRDTIEGLKGIPEGVIWGVARTAKYGLVVQVAGHAAWKLQRLLLQAWDSVRSELLNRPPLRLLKEAWMSS